MASLLLTILLALWGVAAILAVSLCMAAGRADRSPRRALYLVSSR